MKGIRILRRELQHKLEAQERNSRLMRRVMDNCNPDVPNQYAKNPGTYYSIVNANERIGIDATTTQEAFEKSEGLGRIMHMRISKTLATHGNDIALLYQQALEIGFHRRFSGSPAYQHIVDSRIFEKIVTRKLTEKEAIHTRFLLNRYLFQAA